MRRLDVAICADGALRRLLAQSPRRSAAYDAALPLARAPSSQVTWSFLRADCACHQVSATMAMPLSRPGSPGITTVSILISGVVTEPVAVTTKACLHARHLLDLVEVRAHHLAAEHAAFFEDGIQHAGELHVDGENRLAGDDVVQIVL